MQVAERNEARRLRREHGLSLKQIATELGVAKSSVSLWVRDIDLTPEQHARLAAQNRLHSRRLLARSALVEKYRNNRFAAQSEGRSYAKLGDPFHAAGCMLYWAEGSKDRNVVEMTNVDSELLRFFVRFARTYFELADDTIAVTCNLFTDHLDRQRAIEDFWLERLDLPRSCLRKSVVNVCSKYSLKKRGNRLPYGTCRVTICRTSVVQHIYGAIQECAGFDRPGWLD